MKKLLTLLSAFLTPLLLLAQEPVGLDERINLAVKPISDAIAGFVFYGIPLSEGVELPVVLIVLIGAATYFTLYFAFPNITKFRLAINVVSGKYDSLIQESKETEVDNPDTIKVEGHHGELSAFQALTAALSATVGLGNIAGVAIAIAIGGAGATFWMILAGFLGMTSKFVECTLGVKYRDIGPDGTVYGGPMYYLSKGLSEKGMAGLGKGLAIFYAIMMVGGSLGGGNMFQANQAAAQFKQVIGTDSSWAGTAFGVVMAILVAVVILGGIKRIGRVAEKIVPFMVGIYLLGGIVVLVMNYGAIPQAFTDIFNGAFTGAGITGGVVGVLIQGFRRAAFSNEAGVGSASVAHAAVRTKYPASEGIVALLEPFIDTVVVCTMSALVIIIFQTTGAFEYGNLEGSAVIMKDGTMLDGVNLTAAAFDSAIPGFSYVLTLAVILFAFSTMLSWSYYGLQAWKYVFGKSQVADIAYKIMFLSFIVIGSAASLGAVVDFSDSMIFAMIFPNMIGLVILAPKVKEEVAKYIAAIKEKGL